MMMAMIAQKTKFLERELKYFPPMMILKEINIIFLLFQYHEFIREPMERTALRRLMVYQPFEIIYELLIKGGRSPFFS
jgi:hypothetical protein